MPPALREGDFVALLGISSGLSAFGMASIVPALPALGSAFAVNYSAIQFVVSGYLLGLGVAQPVHGILCDRYGRRPVMLAGFGMFTVASIAASFAPSLPVLVAARFLQALGVSVGTVASRAMVRDTHEPEGAAVALAFITAIMGIAPILAPIAGGIVTGIWGWRAIFVMHAAIAASLLAVMWPRLQETLRPGTRAMSGPELVHAASALGRDRGFLGYTLTFAFSNGASFAFITVGADLFARLYAVSPARFGLLWATLAVAYSLGAGFAGTSARRRGSARVFRFGVGLTLAGGLALLAVTLSPRPGLLPFMAALFLMTLASGLVAPLALAGAVSGRPEHAGLASGLSSAAAMLMSMLFAATAGMLYTGAPQPVGLLVAAGCALAALAARYTHHGVR